MLCDIAETHKQGRIAFISRKKKLTKHSPLLQVGFERVFGRRGKLLKRKPYASVFTAFLVVPLASVDTKTKQGEFSIYPRKLNKA